ncbi:hypothetical protein GFC01_01690 [Desulfofundulus thermobenzoicus]|uniref:Uncharacterized protein n=1 Tax=Desulfofundulus thermobenzoicus TaxID=29376 RepID=A0A6N7ILZ0_9FIRM|nr:hypothetical protein [Desulfofundulus thermobenzoicus]MQL51000.1 hypothetical protein [Desulfofundulus thermobenzoicus]
MRIEILTRNMDLKPAVLTFLAGQPGLCTSGNTLRVNGLHMTDGRNYLYFSTGKWEWAEKLVPRLFTIIPHAYGPSYFEPATDQKILVTATARPPAEIMERLSLLEHLDLEAGELAGNFELSWQSRDVRVTCPVSLMVQGGVATAKIKFITHFRDAEHHCRQVINKISLVEVLQVFTPEATGPRFQPVAGALAAVAKTDISPENRARFLNHFAGQISYLEGEEAYRAFFDRQNHLTFRQGNREGTVELYLERVDLLTPALIKELVDPLGIKEISLQQEIEQVTLEPGELIRNLGLNKDRQFHLFTRREPFQACYDIKQRRMEIKAAVNLLDPAAADKLKQLYHDIKQFTARVTASAI